MRWSLAALFTCALALACGARTGLRGTATKAEAGVSCAKPPWIVFDYSDGKNASGIYAMRVDGSSFHALDLGGTRGWLPSISPDGSSMIYLTNNGDEDSLVLRDLPSGNTSTFVHVTVKPPSSGLGKAAVSPDNRFIAYGNSPDVHVANFDGSSDHIVAQGGYDWGCCTWSYGHPVFLADSSTLYFSTLGRLEKVNVDGSGLAILEQDQFTSGTFPGFVFANASLSPDFTQFVAEIACDVSELRIFDVGSLPADPCTTGTKLVETGVSSSDNEASNPSWGPSQIAYNDAIDVYVIDPHGGTKQNFTAQLTTAPTAFASDPVWAPGCANIP